jgi:hypothetical protein
MAVEGGQTLGYSRFGLRNVNIFGVTLNSRVVEEREFRSISWREWCNSGRIQQFLFSAVDILNINLRGCTKSYQRPGHSDIRLGAFDNASGASHAGKYNRILFTYCLEKEVSLQDDWVGVCSRSVRVTLSVYSWLWSGFALRENPNSPHITLFRTLVQ